MALDLEQLFKFHGITPTLQYWSMIFPIYKFSNSYRSPGCLLSSNYNIMLHSQLIYQLVPRNTQSIPLQKRILSFMNPSVTSFIFSYEYSERWSRFFAISKVFGAGKVQAAAWRSVNLGFPNLCRLLLHDQKLSSSVATIGHEPKVTDKDDSG